MNLKKVGAVLAGAALLGATMAGAAAQDVPPTDFFIDPETGEPLVVIIVGGGAAAMDVVSASMMAARVASMAYVEVRAKVTFTDTTIAVHEDINPLLRICNTGNWIGSPPAINANLWGLGYPTVDVPDAVPYNGWDNNLTPINYTLGALWYFDDYDNVYWGDGDQHFDPWETHEEIQIRFDDFYNTQDDMFLEYADCRACLYGGDIDLYNMWDDTLTNLWAWYAIPGLIYRADNIFVPPSIAVQMQYNHPLGTQIVGLDYERIRTFYVPEPWLVYYGMLPQFKLFHTIYFVVDAGACLDVNFRTGELGPLYNTPYLVAGDANYVPQIYLYKHEPMDFGPYTVELMDADVDHNKAWFEISLEGEVIESFWMVLDPMHGFSPNIQQQGPAQGYWAIDHDNDGVPDYYNKWITGRAEKDVWGDYQWKYYVDNRGDAWGLFTVTDFVLDGVKVFIGAQGTIGIEIKVYWLENKKFFYNHLCCDPWVTEANNYQMCLDAYEPCWDEIDENNYYVNQPPGCGMWPPAGLNWWNNIVGNGMFIGNGYLDNNDGHIGFEWPVIQIYWPNVYFPEQDDLDRDGGITNDCRLCDWTLVANCINLPDIEDPCTSLVIDNPMVEINLALCDSICAPGCEYKWPIPGPYPRDPPYFTIEVTDVIFAAGADPDGNWCECPDNDGIYYDTIMEEIQTTEYTTVSPVEIDEIGRVMLDTELDFAGWKTVCSYNLILIGGPVANIIVNQINDEGISAVDWATSPGEWEFIEAPYGDCDILIIAGKDRDATRAAVEELIKRLHESD